MALKVKAVERLLKFTKDENDPGVYRYGTGTVLSEKVKNLKRKAKKYCTTRRGWCRFVIIIHTKTHKK